MLLRRELVGPRRRLVRAVQDRERVHVGDRLGVGAGRHLVHRAAGAVEELQVDLAAVGLVVLREQVDVALVGLLRGRGADVGARRHLTVAACSGFFAGSPM